MFIQHLAETKNLVQERLQEVGEVRRELVRQRERIDSILDSVRSQLSEETSNNSALVPPEPISLWSFDEDMKDSIGTLHGTSVGGAKIEDGALVVRSGGFVKTDPLSERMTEKTLEAWVRLDNLDQRGGGVMTVQTPNGVQFDSIVFGEKQPRHWLAGSNNFQRTESFGGVPESDAVDRWVHVAIVYAKDGQITAYRDGEPYGKSYSSSGPFRFQPNDAIVTFGVRHLPANGNRLLAGRIDQARLYNRALRSDEVAASFSATSGIVTRKQIMAAMSAEQREALLVAEQKINSLEKELESIGRIPAESPDLAAWIDLAHSSFLMKEFIYVR